jgi:hypothetical protein
MASYTSHYIASDTLSTLYGVLSVAIIALGSIRRSFMECGKVDALLVFTNFVALKAVNAFNLLFVRNVVRIKASMAVNAT